MVDEELSSKIEPIEFIFNKYKSNQQKLEINKITTTITNNKSMLIEKLIVTEV